MLWFHGRFRKSSANASDRRIASQLLAMSHNVPMPVTAKAAMTKLV
jgi:hypothetical protein